MPTTTLRQIVQESDTARGRAFDICIQSLIVLSIIAFSIETIPDLSNSTRVWLRGFEVFCVSIFSVEYVLRVIVSRPTHKYIFSFWGLIDILAILPFYLSLGVDLRSIRAFRLLRLFRIFKLARYNAAVRRFHQALIIAREEIVLFFGVALILLYLSAVGIYFFENEAQPDTFGSVFLCLWWAVVTFSTVGYGDVYPITIGGRIFTTLTLLIGLGIVSVPAGLIASALAKARKLEEEGHAVP
ncbi:MAG: ion transporter [Phycisphaeraceae bacterium]|nr:MAG: ion transporter [Phycisphaeraceae bacterium]